MNNKVRAINCLLFFIYSSYLTTKYKLNLLNPSFYFDEIRYIMYYLNTYLIIDLFYIKNRIDLYIHHILFVINLYFNWNGLTVIFLLNECITIAYLLPIKYQKLYRFICLTFIRLPIWTVYYFTDYYFYEKYSLIHNYTSFIGVSSIICMDIYWNYKIKYLV